MDQCNGVGAFGQPLKADICGIPGRDLGAVALGVFAAIREEFRVCGHTHKDIALHAAQPMHIDIEY